MSEGYAVYRPDGDDETPAPAPGEVWQVLVEYSNPSAGKPATMLHLFAAERETREEAVLEAEAVAWAFEPPDPTFPQGRTVYADGAGFLTIVEGATSTFHFSTRAVRRLS